MKKYIATAAVLGLVSAVSASDVRTYTGNGFDFADNDPAGATSVINVGDDVIVESVELTIHGLNHTWVGDLVVTLENPDGDVADIMNRTGDAQNDCCGDSSDLGADYTFADGGADWWAAAAAAGGGDVIAGGTYAASTGFDGSIVNLNDTLGGGNATGDWTLFISDNAGGDLGGFSSWTLTLKVSEVPAPGAIALLGLAGLTGTRRRRA